MSSLPAESVLRKRWKGPLSDEPVPSVAASSRLKGLELLSSGLAPKGPPPPNAPGP